MPKFASPMPSSLALLLLAALSPLGLGPLRGALADQPHFGAADYEAYNSGAYGDRPNQTYHSSDIRSPAFLINTWKKEAVSPETHIFLSPAVGGQHRSPMVFSARDLSLVYADPSWDGGQTANLQWHDGRAYLTFWSGRDYIGWGSGYGLMLDDSFRLFANVTTTDDAFPATGADSHEFQLTHDGGALVNNYYKRPDVDISALGGPADGLLHDSAFQEIDLATGAARFTWRASDHFALHESMNGYIFDADGGGWDWFHQNSLQKTAPGGDYLISARHLSCIALVSGRDGSRLWQLGGKNNSFEDLSGGRATRFGFQHHARFAEDGPRDAAGRWTELTFFANNAEFAGGAPTPGCRDDDGGTCSRAVRVALDYDRMTARLVRDWHHPRGVQAWAQGGVHALPGGGALVAWGTVPSVTEVAADGDTVLEVQLSPWAAATGGRDGVSLYRAYKLNFTAHPPWGPSVACVGGSTLYVSWNGATEVAVWSVFGGEDTVNLQSKDHVVPRAGFETAIELAAEKPLSYRYAQVRALDAEGKALGSTDLVDLRTGNVLTVKVQLDRQ
ncbi:hypothetical protein SLS62_007491 [Diatrype stigma]|uniref:Uncharacterized protein n=1 Tax=Diatrype stigma TaxID=117547 RepID=A0AAN9UWR8_9PEZI